MHGAALSSVRVYGVLYIKTDERLHQSRSEEGGAIVYFFLSLMHHALAYAMSHFSQPKELL